MRRSPGLGGAVEQRAELAGLGPDHGDAGRRAHLGEDRPAQMPHRHDHRRAHVTQPIADRERKFARGGWL